MMKSRRFFQWAVATALLIPPTAASADVFRFTYETEDGVSWVRDAPVEVTDDASKTRYDGRTDGYGRIRLDVEPGRYDAVVRYDGKSWRVELTVDGEDGLENLEEVPIN